MHRDHIGRDLRQKILPVIPTLVTSGRPASCTVLHSFCNASSTSIRPVIHRSRLDCMRTDAVAFKEISLAHGLLSDPEKRRKFDVGGFDNLEESDLDMEIDVSQLGVTGAAFAAMFSKLGVPIKTAVSQSVLDTVRSPSTLNPTHVCPTSMTLSV